MPEPTKRRDTLSAGEARRIAVRAQGFGRPTTALPSTQRMRGEIDRMVTLQIDSVNVFARSHYMPLFSRLGAYDTAQLDRSLFSGSAPFVEYWAHQASFIRAADWPLFRFRMEEFRARRERRGWPGTDNATLDWVRGELASRGPLRPAEIEDDAAKATRGRWWDWSAVKSALEYLWLTGEVTIAGRRGFERRYALASQVLPADIVDRVVDRSDAVLELTRRAARAYGVATLADLDDYWRISDQRSVRLAVEQLVDEGELTPVSVAGWERGGKALPAWLHRDAIVPRRTPTTSILTPFDPLVWFRGRAERLFDFSYRIEIYTPAPQRRFGYYSLPVLHDDAVVGRVDLKADRARSTLLVQSAWWEPGAIQDAARTAAVLHQAAAWQGLEHVSVSNWGDATTALAAELRAERHESGLAQN